MTLSDVTPVDQHTSAAGTTTLPISRDTLAVDAGPASGDSTDGAANGVWDRLAPGDAAEFTASYTVTQADVDAQTAITNTVTVSASGPPGTTIAPVATSASVTPDASAAQLDAVKTDDALGLSSPPAPGEVVSYRIMATNTGNVTLSNVTLAETLTDASGGAQALDAAPAYVSGDDGDGLLQVGESWTHSAQVTLTQAMIDAGGLSNTVTVSAEAPDGTPTSDVSDNGDDTDGNTTDDANVTALTAGLALAAIKTVSFDDGGDGRADVGDIVTYDNRVTNPGNVTVFDLVLSETSFTGTGTPPVPTQISAGTAVGGDPAIADLEVGDTATFQATYALTQADIDAGALTNQATASGAAPDGTPVSDLTGTTGAVDDPTVLPIAPGPVLAATLTADTSGLSRQPRAGTVLPYTITLENTGNVTITGPGFAATVTDRAGDTG